MSDLAEALEHFSPNKPSPWPSETTEDYDERYLAWLRSHDPVVAAARAYAEPLWEGNWCTAHSSNRLDGNDHCHHYNTGYPTKPCRIVRGVRVVANEERK